MAINISKMVLVGMPNVGKTTLANWVGDDYSRPVVDIDDFICNIYNIDNPKEFIDIYGISRFRKEEYEALKFLISSGDKRHVISTGGGILQNDDVYNMLIRTDEHLFIVWIKTYLKYVRIPKTINKSKKKLAEEIYPKYQNVCDCIVYNNRTKQPELIASRLQELNIIHDYHPATFARKYSGKGFI